MEAEKTKSSSVCPKILMVSSEKILSSTGNSKAPTNKEHATKTSPSSVIVAAPKDSQPVEHKTTTETKSHLTSNPAKQRLSDADVRKIFASLHSPNGMAPPSHLPFNIVEVQAGGHKLSPPNYEFQDGLYVLLRPKPRRGKKTSGGELPDPQPPTHLRHLLLQDYPPQTCSWSLSGPQFPIRGASVNVQDLGGGNPNEEHFRSICGGIQQRYCYPRNGAEEYTRRTGGALWTMYRACDDKEDVEFRLLHVYRSQKRAANKQQTKGNISKTTARRAKVPQTTMDSVATPVQRVNTKRKALPLAMARAAVRRRVSLSTPRKQRRLTREDDSPKVKETETERYEQPHPTPPTPPPAVLDHAYYQQSMYECYIPQLPFHAHDPFPAYNVDAIFGHYHPVASTMPEEYHPNSHHYDGWASSGRSQPLQGAPKGPYIPPGFKKEDGHEGHEHHTSKSDELDDSGKVIPDTADVGTMTNKAWLKSARPICHSPLQRLEESNSDDTFVTANDDPDLDLIRIGDNDDHDSCAELLVRDIQPVGTWTEHDLVENHSDVLARAPEPFLLNENTQDPQTALANLLEQCHQSIHDTIQSGPPSLQKALKALVSKWGRQVVENPMAIVDALTLAKEDGPLTTDSTSSAGSDTTYESKPTHATTVTAV